MFIFDFAVILTGLVMGFNNFDINDYRTYDDISVYEERLAEFNEEHNINFMIPYEPMVGTHDDIVEFYTSMTLKEFDDYIMSLYDGSFYDSPEAAEQATVDLPDYLKENAKTYEFETNKTNNKNSYTNDMTKNLPVKDDEFAIVFLK